MWEWCVWCVWGCGCGRENASFLKTPIQGDLELDSKEEFELVYSHLP